MPWNHRVIRTAPDTPDGEAVFAIHEAFYDERMAVDAIPHSWTAEPVEVSAEDMDGLRWMLEKMEACLDKPVLEVAPDNPGKLRVVVR